MNKTLNIGTFNVRGLNDEQKQIQLAQDIETYKVDILCLQETKIQKCISIRNHRLISLETLNVHYGNGFLVSSRWKTNIYKLWKVSHRIAVLQLKTKQPEYRCLQETETHLRILRKVSYKSRLIKKRTQKNNNLYECAQLSDTKIRLYIKIHRSRREPESEMIEYA